MKHAKALSLYDIDFQSPSNPMMALLASKFPYGRFVSDVDLHSTYAELDNVTIDEQRIHHLASYFLDQEKILQMNGDAGALRTGNEGDDEDRRDPRA